MLAAGLDASQFSAHKLRHTAATLMVSSGVDVKTVQEVLGHENLNTTQIYTHIESTELKIAAEANPISNWIPQKGSSKRYSPPRLLRLFFYQNGAIFCTFANGIRSDVIFPHFAVSSAIPVACLRFLQ